MEGCEGAFAEEDAVEVAADAKLRDDEEDEGDSDAEGGYVVEEGGAGFAKAVEDAGQGGV